MNPDSFSLKKSLFSIRIIYFSMLTGILVFFFLILKLLNGQFIFKADLSNPLLLALFILSCLVIPGGYFFSKLYIKRTETESSAEAKYRIYQTVFLIRISLCESVSLFAVVCLLMTTNLFTAIFLGISILAILFYFPTPVRIGAEINLTESEIESFYQ
jgi:hypothetical protein